MIVKGWASTAKLDSGSHSIADGAFDHAIAMRGCDGIALRLDHDAGLPAGRILKLSPLGPGLWIEAALDPALPDVAARIALIRRDHPQGFSVGGWKRRFRRNADGSLLIHTVDLIEISLTEYPKNTDCRLIFDAPAASPWPADIQETFAEQDRAAAAAPPRPILPPIRYGDIHDHSI